jgi:hypothetical protein
MKKIAITQARGRLEKVQAALAALTQARTFADADSAWSDFLLASSGVYSKLEQGAKGAGKSEAWFGRKKYERKHDPLLRYIHHARNADEHGIEPVTAHHTGSFAAAGNGAYRLDGSGGPDHVDLKITHLGGEPPRIEITRPSVKLVLVRDARYGDTFEPPAAHLGNALEDQSPLAVAKLALSYLECLLAEGSELVE